MKVLITTLGSSGDVNPLIAVALALKGRGHDVTMLVNHYFERQIRDAGLGFVPLGEPMDLRVIAEMPELMKARTALRRTLEYLVIPHVPVTIEAVGRLLSDWKPDVVLGGHTSYGARWVCERGGVPYLGAVLTPLAWLSRYDPAVFLAFEPENPPAWYLRHRVHAAQWMLRVAIDRRFNRIRKRYGFRPERDQYLADVLGGRLNLGLWSPHFRGPLPDDPANGRICGFVWFDRHQQFEHASDEIEEFLAEGEPPVIFTLGTAAVHVAGPFFHHAVESCRILGRRGLLLTRHREFAPQNLPPSVRAFTYAPFSSLLPRGCATVHHGGVGTTAQAMRAGRPTVIVPFSHDQFDNAARAKRLGLSTTLKRPRVTPHALAQALQSVLTNPEVARRARDFGTILAQEDGAHAAAAAVEQVAEDGCATSPGCAPS